MGQWEFIGGFSAQEQDNIMYIMKTSLASQWGTDAKVLRVEAGTAGKTHPGLLKEKQHSKS